MKQLTLAAVGFERYAKTTRRAGFLAEMERVVPWPALCALIEPFYPKPGNGRPPVGVERMLRIYFLQQWFNLSDPAVEEALYDSSAMRRFVDKIDVTSEPEWIDLIANVEASYDRLDILVNNAGISGSSVGDPDGLEGWHRIIAVNQTSVFLGTKLAAERMAKSGGGSIVNISSIMGFVGSTSGHPAYHASKGAVRIYSKAAAVRYGPSGVRVNTVHPGYMPPMLNATNAAERADKVAMTPLRRIGKPIEVAYGVLFLASDEASFVTGTELVIDGGFVAQ